MIVCLLPARNAQAELPENFENVAVNTNGLTILGVKKGVFVDGHDDATDTHDQQFDISANGARIKNLALRHRRGIYCNADRCKFDRLRFRASDSNCVDISGDDALVQRSSFHTCSSAAIYVNGEDAKILGNSIRQVDSTCIDLSFADRTVVRNNKLRSCYGYGIYADNSERVLVTENVLRNIESSGIWVNDDRARVIKNEVSNSDDYCVSVSGGDKAQVRGNRVTNCYDRFDLSGENLKVVGNVSQFSEDYGFDISCSTADPQGCDNTVIKNNTARVTTDGYEGFYVFQTANTGSMRIANNRAFETSAYGFYISGVNTAAIVGNIARNAGGGDSGFYVSGSGNRFVGNVAAGNADDGFYIAHHENVLEDNVAKSNSGDGIEVNTNELNTKLLRNKTIGNFAEGIDNGGTNTVVRRNVSRKNRTDCANDGVIAVKEKNKCADGSNFNVPPNVSRPGRR